MKNFRCKFMKGKSDINKTFDANILRDSSFLLLEHGCAFWAVPAAFRFGLQSHAAKVEPFNGTILVVTPVDIQKLVHKMGSHQDKFQEFPPDHLPIGDLLAQAVGWLIGVNRHIHNWHLNK